MDHRVGAVVITVAVGRLTAMWRLVPRRPLDLALPMGRHGIQALNVSGRAGLAGVGRLHVPRSVKTRATLTMATVLLRVWHALVKLW